MSAPGSRYPDVIHTHPASSGGAGVSYVVYATFAGLAMGVLGGFVWAQVADPPEATVTKQGVFLTGELGYDQQVSVTFWFLTVGLGLGLLAGLVLALLGRRHGVTTVIAVLALTAVASWLSGYLGIHVFGPDLNEQLADAQPGDTVTAALTIGTKVAYLGWPIGGLVGSIIGMAFWPAVDKSPAVPPWSSTVVSQ